MKKESYNFMGPLPDCHIKVSHYYLSVDAITATMRVRENPEPCGEPHT